MKKRIGAAFAVTALLLGLTACATEGGGSTPASSQTTSPDSQTSSGGTQESYINTLPRNRGPAGEVGVCPIVDEEGYFDNYDDVETVSYTHLTLPTKA